MLIDLIGLSVFCILVNYPLLFVGVALHDSDQMIYPLAAENIIKTGKWALFPFTQTYGGLAYTWLRVPWVKTWLLLQASPDAHIMAQMAFSYFVSPLILLFLTYLLVRSQFSRRAALLTGLVAAVGFHFWYQMMGQDHFIALIFCGLVFFWLRGREANPIKNFSNHRLMLAAVFSGFSTYIFQPCLIFVAAFFIPWGVVVEDFKKAPRYVRVPILLLFLIWFIILCFGEQLGPVKLKAFPNLKIAAAIFLVYLVLKYGSLVWAKYWPKFLLTILGFAVGLLPEIVFVLINQEKGFSVGRTGPTPPMAKLFFSLMELAVGRAGPLPYAGIALLGPLLLVAWALVNLFVRATKADHLKAVVAVVLLNVASYFVVSMTSFGHPRYLFPLFPVFLFSIGLLVEDVFSKKNSLPKVALVLLILTHVFYGVVQRWNWVNSGTVLARQKTLNEVTQKLVSFNVDNVLSDDFWNSLQYTMLTNGRPLVTPLRLPWPAPQEWEAARRSTPVGLLISGDVIIKGSILTFEKYSYKIAEEQKAGPYRLFKAEFLKVVDN